MEKQAQLIVGRAAWGAAAAELLRDCFTVPGALEQVAQQVKRGRAKLFLADDGGGIVAAFVLRTEGAEGVIVAANAESIELLPALLPHIEARFIGCKSVRFHTARAGLARMMMAHGYGGQEIVLRKDYH